MSLSERVAQVSVVTSSALAAAGVVIFVLAGLAHRQGSDVVAALVFGLPACAIFVFSAQNVHQRNFARAAIVCVVGGLLMLVQIILVGLSAAYADPCFEVTRCTRGPTFVYVALTAATIVFVFATVLGLLISPATIAFARWRAGSVGTVSKR